MTLFLFCLFFMPFLIFCIFGGSKPEDGKSVWGRIKDFCGIFAIGVVLVSIVFCGIAFVFNIGGVRNEVTGDFRRGGSYDTSLLAVKGVGGYEFGSHPPKDARAHYNAKGEEFFRLNADGSLPSVDILYAHYTPVSRQAFEFAFNVAWESKDAFLQTLEVTHNCTFSTSERNEYLEDSWIHKDESKVANLQGVTITFENHEYVQLSKSYDTRSKERVIQFWRQNGFDRLKQEYQKSEEEQRSISFWNPTFINFGIVQFYTNCRVAFTCNALKNISNSESTMRRNSN